MRRRAALVFGNELSRTLERRFGVIEHPVFLEQVADAIKEPRVTGCELLDLRDVSPGIRDLLRLEFRVDQSKESSGILRGGPDGGGEMRERLRRPRITRQRQSQPKFRGPGCIPEF